MNKEEIIRQLNLHYQALHDQLEGLPPEKWHTETDGKWSPAQQLDHMNRSTAALLPVFALPKFVLRLLFGKPTRPSVSYQELVDMYLQALEKGGKASGKYLPASAAKAKREDALRQITWLVQRLSKGIGKWKDAQLDQYQLPHPLIGKITVREMLYFTAYHAEHHRQIIARHYA